VQVHTSTETVHGSVVVTVDGPVDLAAVGRLHGDLARAIRQHPATTLIVDLDAASALDDAGLGVLLGAAATAREAGGDLQIVCTQPTLRSRLERTRLDQIVTVRASIADSNSHVASSGSSAPPSAR